MIKNYYCQIHYCRALLVIKSHSACQMNASYYIYISRTQIVYNLLRFLIFVGKMSSVDGSFQIQAAENPTACTVL